MNKLFFKAAGIRAVKTMCQTAVVMIGTATVISEVPWWTVISSAILTGIASMLTSIYTGLPEVPEIDMEEVGMLADHYDTDRSGE